MILVIPYICKPLAYDLHLWPGRVCSRQGGNAICGECIGDIDAPALGFRRDQLKLNAAMNRG